MLNIVKDKYILKVVALVFASMLFAISATSCGSDDASTSTGDNSATNEEVSSVKDSQGSTIEQVIADDPAITEQINKQLDAMRDSFTLDDGKQVYSDVKFYAQGNVILYDYVYAEQTDATLDDLKGSLEGMAEMTQSVRSSMAKEFGKDDAEVSMGYIYRNPDQSLVACVRFDKDADPIISDSLDIFK